MCYHYHNILLGGEGQRAMRWMVVVVDAVSNSFGSKTLLIKTHKLFKMMWAKLSSLLLYFFYGSALHSHI